MNQLKNHRTGLNPSPPLTAHQRDKAWMVAAHLNAHVKTFGPAPEEGSDYDQPLDLQTAGDYKMLGNDKAGNCADAAAGHAEMVVSANTGAVIIPTEAEVMALYSKQTGYDPNAPLVNGENPTDNGTDMSALCAYLRANGCLGDRVLGTAHIDPANLEHQKWANILLGPVLMGYTLPYDSEDQFNAGLPWTTSFMQRIRRSLGGHCVVWEKYGKRGVKLMTWGRAQWADWAWHNRFVMECEVIVLANWLRNNNVSPYGQTADQIAAGLQELGD